MMPVNTSAPGVAGQPPVDVRGPAFGQRRAHRGERQPAWRLAAVEDLPHVRLEASGGVFEREVQHRPRLDLDRPERGRARRDGQR